MSIAFNFWRPNNNASYLVVLFVDWNSNIVAYSILRPKGGMIIIAVHVDEEPHKPSLGNGDA